MKTISFFVVAKNSGKTIGNLLEDLRSQSYPHDHIEVLLVDGLSGDDTKALMQAFGAHSDFARVLVLDNPLQNLPAGWNVALTHSRHEIIVRVDAHGRIPSDFLEHIAADFEAGEHIVGGPRPSVTHPHSGWQRTLLLAETALFGSGIALYRRSEQRRYVKSVAHGAYGREVFERVGGYDLRLCRTEDNDMHHRMRQAGYQILFDPAVRSTHHVRSSFAKMLRQKFGNGYWIGCSMCISPKCFEAFHFAPLLFVLALLATAAAAGLGEWLPLAVLAAAYGLADVGMSVLSLPGKGFSAFYLLLPVLFLLLHLSYGVGTALGLIYAPFYKALHPTCEQIDQVRRQMLAADGEPL